jgi:hypothetical protein
MPMLQCSNTLAAWTISRAAGSRKATQETCRTGYGGL